MAEEMEQKTQDRLLRSVLFTFFISGMASQPLGSFIPFLREQYGFSYDLSGLLLSCQSTGNLISVFLAGVLPIYLGRRRAILTTSVWMLAAYLIIASGIGSPVALVAAFAMTGIARGGNSNFSNTMVSTLSGDKAAQGYNLLHGSFAVGALLSPVLLVFCVNRWPGVGWRLMAGVLGLLCVSQIAVYATMPLPQEKAGKSIKEVDYSFFRLKQFWLSSLVLFFYISVEYAIVGWLVSYFQDTGMLSANIAQMMNSLLWLVIFCGRMVGAAIVNKVSRSVLLLVDGTGLFICFLLMFFSRTPQTIIVTLIGVGLFMATVYPTAFAFGSDCIRGNDLGCSILIFAGTGGGIVAPAMVGMISEWTGNIRSGMAVIAVATALLLLSIIFNVISVKRVQDREKDENAKGV